MNVIQLTRATMPELTQEDIRSKRRAILEAARTIIAKQGYEETTIAQIAAAAGVAVGTVYLYFRNKREIYTSLSIDWVETMAEALQDPRIAALPIEHVPRAMIGTVFRLCHEHSDLMPFLQVDIQSNEEMRLHKESEALITRALDIFFRSAIERGQLAPFDTEMYAKIIFGTVHSVLYDCFCIEEGKYEEEYRERTIEFMERLFFGPPIAIGYHDSPPKANQ
jgi:TetR/AcrR family fatty acid metabolism transcriptional regulator